MQSEGRRVSATFEGEGEAGALQETSEVKDTNKRYALSSYQKEGMSDTEYLELAKAPEKDDIRYALADNGTVMSAPAGIFSALRQKAYISVGLSSFALGRFWFLRTDFRIFMQN